MYRQTNNSRRKLSGRDDFVYYRGNFLENVAERFPDQASQVFDQHMYGNAFSHLSSAPSVHGFIANRKGVYSLPVDDIQPPRDRTTPFPNVADLARPSTQPSTQQKDASRNATTLFVGDLSVVCDEEKLYELFHRFGKIESIQLKKGDNSTQRAHLSYGFIKFFSRDAAARALEELNGFPFLGRNIRVGWALDRPIGGAAAVQMKSAKTVQSAQVHVTFISKHFYQPISELDLRQVFERFGNLIDCAIKRRVFHQEAGIQSGYGFVHFAFTDEGIQSALAAIEEVNGRVVNDISFECSVTHTLKTHLYSVRLTGKMTYPEPHQDLSYGRNSAQVGKFEQTSPFPSTLPIVHSSDFSNPYILPADPTSTFPRPFTNSIGITNSANQTLSRPYPLPLTKQLSAEPTLSISTLMSSEKPGPQDFKYSSH